MVLRHAFWMQLGIFMVIRPAKGNMWKWPHTLVHMNSSKQRTEDSWALQVYGIRAYNRGSEIADKSIITEVWLNNLSAYHNSVVHGCKTLILGAHTYTSPYIISIHHQSSSANLNSSRLRLPQPWRSQCRFQLRRQWLRGQRGAWPKTSVSGSARSVGCIPYFSSLWGLSSWVAACTAILRYPERLQRMEM